MARITVNLICNTICETYGVERKYLSMDKFEGTYHWCGEFALLLSATEMNTHIVKLSDWTLDRWLSAFDCKVQAETSYGNMLFDYPLSQINNRIKELFED